MPETESVVIHDGHVVLECNDAFCDLFRCDCDEVVGMRMVDLIADHDLRRLAVARGKRIMKEPEVKQYTMEYVFRRCDGSTFWGKSFSQRLGPDRYETRIKWLYDDVEVA